MSATEWTLKASDEQATRAIAEKLARACDVGDCIALVGDLGAGKTTFARGFIHALIAGPEEVVSPTFTLVQTYASATGIAIAHFDLYRLKNPHELIEIGFEYALQHGITLIEWPHMAQEFLPVDTLTVTIAPGDAAHARQLIFSGDATWKSRMKAIQ